MTVRDKIKQKQARLAEKAPAVAKEKLYTCTCMLCKATYNTPKELDLDGQGRCPSCQAIRDAEIAVMLQKFPPQPKEPREPSFDETPGIVYNGIKFIPLH